MTVRLTLPHTSHKLHHIQARSQYFQPVDSSSLHDQRFHLLNAGRKAKIKEYQMSLHISTFQAPVLSSTQSTKISKGDDLIGSKAESSLKWVGVQGWYCSDWFALVFGPFSGFEVRQPGTRVSHHPAAKPTSKPKSMACNAARSTRSQAGMQPGRCG